MGLGGKVAIIGSGVIKFGENFHQSLTDMVYEAVTLALADAKVERGRLQAAWLGCYEPMLYGFEGNSGTFVSDPLNLFPIPVTRVAAYCATGIEAVRNASLAIASGEYDLVLAVGAEKMREVPSRGSLVAQAVNRGHPVLAKGRTAPGMFALLATRYFKEYGANEEALGAAAVILTRADLAPTFTDRYSVIRGIAYAVTAGYWNTQFDPSWNFTSFRATREAAKAAYAMAGISNPAREIDVAECHDCFTITEIVNYEDLGFAEPGAGWRYVQDGVTKLGGDLPVNTSGGLKSCGHPIGSSGVRMIANIHDQLLGRAGKMQVKDARMGLAHNLGGPGAVSAVAVLSQP